MKDFWLKYNIPVQDEYLELDSLNPADAYRKQADAINYAAPLYEYLEHIDFQLERVVRIEKELRSRILAQNMPLPSSSTRTNELIDAFILNKSIVYITESGEIKDISNFLLKVSRKKSKLEYEKSKTERRLRALESMADKCDSILNWNKHEARLELR